MADQDDVKPDGERVSLLELQASRLLGIPGWEAHSFRVVDPSSILMEGGVYRTVLRSGKRKGRKNYSKPEPGTVHTIVISESDRLAFEAAWEAETGKCHQCTGTRVTIKSTGVSGTTWRTCRRCEGSGQRPTEVPRG